MLDDNANGDIDISCKLCALQYWLKGKTRNYGKQTVERRENRESE